MTGRNDSSAESREAQPCPFCGALPLKTRAAETFIIHCGNADCDVTCEINGASPELVISAWNSRTGDAAQSAWMLIETAPRDEDLLLGWWREWPERKWEMASGLAGSTKGGWLHGQATHWQRLPGPPDAAQTSAAPVEELRAFCRPLLGDVGSANDRAFERLIAKLSPPAATVETRDIPPLSSAERDGPDEVTEVLAAAVRQEEPATHSGLLAQGVEGPRCSADRESERKSYAEAWHRQIIKAGADENVAHQAITIAALVGLFDYFNERPSAEGWQIQQSVPSDGFECYYLLRNGITVAEICGRQTDQRTRQLTELIAAANRAEPQTAAVTRPAAFLAWAVEMFGPVAKLRGERLMRFIEEAIELAHADEMERATLDAIANRVYSRPPGEIPQEIGQAQACLETYAENIGECSALQAEIEWHRVQTVPVEEVRRRHRAKQEIGIALSDPSTVTRPQHS